MSNDDVRWFVAVLSWPLMFFSGLAVTGWLLLPTALDAFAYVFRLVLIFTLFI